MAALYRAAPPETLLVASLDILTAIYHRASGQTHLMAAPAPEILAVLGGEGMTVEALMDRLRAEYDLVDADPVALVARLDELVATGLVERS